MKVHAFMALHGQWSRRQAEQLVKQGLVQVNGVRASVGQRVLSTDQVKVANQLVDPFDQKNRQILLYHKPRGFVVTRDDPHAKDTIYQHLPLGVKWLYAGRLDKMSEGLLVLTNWGPYVQYLTHPKFEQVRIYHVLLAKSLLPEQIKALSTGLMLEDGLAKCDHIKPLKQGWYSLTLQTGRNRIIRRMMKAIGVGVIRLKRLSHGPFTLPRDLKVGMCRRVDDQLIS
jgi:23S rRNA pseudouridine2605 synthase